MFTFDLKNQHYAHTLERYARALPHNYNTRAKTSQNLYAPSVNLRISQNSLPYCIVNHWNNLPSFIKNETSRATFKYTLKKHLLNA